MNTLGFHYNWRINLVGAVVSLIIKALYHRVSSGGQKPTACQSVVFCSR